jgi:ankyrin repeat protein
MTLSTTDFANANDNELFRAIKVQQWSAVETLLQEEPDLARQEDEFGNVPLHSAIGFGMPDHLVLQLISIYPEACYRHGTDDWLPLHVAAMWGVSTSVLEALILIYPEALDDTGQQQQQQGTNNKGRSPRHFSGRFDHNRHLLERSTDEWKQIILSQQQQQQRQGSSNNTD